MTRTNPLRAWIETQPIDITQASIARRLGLSRSYVSELFSDDEPKTPSLKLSVAIEELTDGAVTPVDILAFVGKKRRP